MKPKIVLYWNKINFIYKLKLAYKLILFYKTKPEI